MEEQVEVATWGQLILTPILAFLLYGVGFLISFGVVALLAAGQNALADFFARLLRHPPPLSEARGLPTPGLTRRTQIDLVASILVVSIFVVGRPPIGRRQWIPHNSADVTTATGCGANRLAS
jgi:hypothetical protein